MLLYFWAWVSVRLSVLAFYDALCLRAQAANMLMSVCFGPQSLWVERTTMTLVQSLPGISRWFEVDKRDLVRESILKTTAPLLKLDLSCAPCGGPSVTAVCCGTGGGEPAGERHRGDWKQEPAAAHTHHAVPDTTDAEYQPAHHVLKRRDRRCCEWRPCSLPGGVQISC